MRRPGERGSDQNAQHRILGNGGEDDARRRRLFGRGQRVDENVQGEQDQAKPDEDAADLRVRL